MRHSFILILSLLISFYSSPQSFNLSTNYSDISYLPVEEIWNVQISYQQIPSNYFFMKIKLSDENMKELLIGRSKTFLFPNNLSEYNFLQHKNENGNYEIEFKDKDWLSKVEKSGGLIPPGKYFIEYTLLSTTAGCNWAGDVAFQNGWWLDVQHFNRIELLSPPDGDSIDDLLPVFVWLPLIPDFDREATYHLRLVEMLLGQDAEQAVSATLPFYEEINIKTTSMAYPAGARTLEKGKWYAWQVWAEKQGKVLAFSNVFKFYIKDKQQIPASDSKTVFIYVNENENNNQWYQVFGDYLYLVYYEGKSVSASLNYSISDVNTNREKLNGKSQPLSVKEGKNLYRIDISSLKNDKYKMVLLRSEGGEEKVVLFEKFSR